MEDRVLSAGVLIVLVTVAGGHGLTTLFRAFRAPNTAIWTEQAVQGGLGIIASAIIADAVVRLFV